MLEILNGRDKFYQWDVNQKLIVDDNIIAVQYDNGTGDALVCGVYEYEGQRVADVPNIMLQTYWAIKCYAYCGECVRAEKVYEVEKRSRPDDYIYTETETLRYSTLFDMLNDLEAKHNEDVAALENEIKINDRKRQEIVDIHIPNIYNDINENLDSINEINRELDNITSKVMTNEGELQKLKQYTGESVDKIYGEMTEQEIIIYDNQARIEELEKRPTGGGGGSASEVDWAENDETSPAYIKNRTHYEAYETGTLLAEKAPDVLDGGQAYYVYPCLETEPAAGMEYTVNWNGVEYKCVSVDGAEIGEAGCIVLGNYDLMMGGEGTGEPFVILMLGDEAAASEGIALMVFIIDGATELTMSISYAGNVIHKLDNKYLNLNNYYTGEQTETAINDKLANYYTKYEVNEKTKLQAETNKYHKSAAEIGDTGTLDISGYKNVRVIVSTAGTTLNDAIKIKLYDKSGKVIANMTVAENMAFAETAEILAYYISEYTVNIDVCIGNTALLTDMKRVSKTSYSYTGEFDTIQIYTESGNAIGGSSTISVWGW